MDKYQEQRKLAINALSNCPPASLFADPIEYIFADHFRQRSLCSILEQITGQKQADIEMARAAHGFLKSDFGLHILDEEEDLFPLLRRRMTSEDSILGVLGDLARDHALGRMDGAAVVDVLEDVLQDRNPACNAGQAKLFNKFAANEKRHLICENAIVLPLARVRLTRNDLTSLGRRMAARRGLSYPEFKK